MEKKKYSLGARAYFRISKNIARVESVTHVWYGRECGEGMGSEGWIGEEDAGRKVSRFEPHITREKFSLGWTELDATAS